jgi:hypothetical protein
MRIYYLPVQRELHDYIRNTIILLLGHLPHRPRDAANAVTGLAAAGRGASSKAVAWPMPLVAPVTRQTRPLSRPAGAGTGGGPARSISEGEFVMGGTLQIAVPELRCPTGYPAALRRRQSHGPRRDAVRPIDR